MTIDLLRRVAGHPLDRMSIGLLRRETLGSILDRLAEIHGDQVLSIEPERGRELTYRQAAELVARWSDAIGAAVAPGDRVVIGTPNGYDQFLLCLAAARAGAVPVPVNDQMHDNEIAHVISDASADLVIRSVEDLSPVAPILRPARAEVGDLAALFYTSGTTGSPKGVALSHRSLVGQLGSGALLPPILPLGEAIVALPVAHIMGFVTYLGLAVAGISAVSLPRFRAAEVLDLIESRRSTIFIGVPAMYRKLIEAGAEGRDLSSVRVWMSGADAMPPDLALRFKSMGSLGRLPLIGAIGEAAFVEGYGMVEVGGGVAVKVSPPGVSFGAGESLGFRLPGYHFRVVDESGRDVRVGATGELWLKGPGVLQGYWNAPDATAEVLTPDGWLRTGDLVRSGPFGTVLFQGRRKQVIKSGGYSVYPREVESVLETHPDVLEAVVVGLRDDALGEVPAAAVRLRPGATSKAHTLVAWSADRLAHYKAPRVVKVVDTLPRTGTDKVQHDRVREMFD